MRHLVLVVWEYRYVCDVSSAQTRKENPVVAKVLGMHAIVLRPGVKEEDFERLMAEGMPKLRLYEGWKYYLLKGDRGDRKGRYLYLIEIGSVESRDRYAPADNVSSEEARKFAESLSEEE